MLMRFVAARVAHADSSVRTFARRMAGRTACAAHSIRTFAALLAMPRLRSQCTKVGAIFLVGSMRVRSAVNTPTPVRWIIVSRCWFPLGFYFPQRPCLDVRFQASYSALLESSRLCISCTWAHGIRSSWRFGGPTCRMLCIVVWDNWPRWGHVPGNARTLRR